MTRMLKLFLGLAALATLARAAPAPLFGINLGSGDESSDKPASVSQDDITSTLVRPAQFARAAYCSAASVTNWSCGDSCDVLPNVEVLTAGGDDGAIPGCECLRSLPSATRALTRGRCCPPSFSLRRLGPRHADDCRRAPGHGPQEDPLDRERRRVPPGRREHDALPAGERRREAAQRLPGHAGPHRGPRALDRPGRPVLDRVQERARHGTLARRGRRVARCRDAPHGAPGRRRGQRGRLRAAPGRKPGVGGPPQLPRTCPMLPSRTRVRVRSGLSLKSNLARARVRFASFRFVDPGLRACDEPERPGAERPAALPRLPAPPGRAAYRLRGRLDGRCADRDVPWAGERGERCHRTHANQTYRTLRSQNCAAGNSLLDTSIPNHLGPYLNGISFGDKACPN